MMNTNWASHQKVPGMKGYNPDYSAWQGSFYAWEFGFEFYTNDADFVPTKGSDDAKKPTLFSKSKYATPMFTIDLHAKDNKYPSGYWAPAQWLAALQPNFSLDPTKLRPKFLIKNNIVTKRAFVDADYDYVHNVLTKAGIKLPKNNTSSSSKS